MTSIVSNQRTIPDENNLDFGWSVIDDGCCILVTPPIQDLTIDLEEKSCPPSYLFNL